MNTQSKRINRIGKIGWEKHMAAWQSSGLTQAAYCRSHDLNPRYFSVWKKKCKRNRIRILKKLINQC